MSTSEDVYRLERHVKRLEAHLRQERRSIWRRLIGSLSISRLPQTSAAAEKPATRPLQAWEVADLIQRAGSRAHVGPAEGKVRPLALSAFDPGGLAVSAEPRPTRTPSLPAGESVRGARPLLIQ
jgi:hypothetical protein